MSFIDAHIGVSLGGIGTRVGRNCKVGLHSNPNQPPIGSIDADYEGLFPRLSEEFSGFVQGRSGADQDEG